MADSCPSELRQWAKPVHAHESLVYIIRTPPVKTRTWSLAWYGLRQILTVGRDVHRRGALS